MKNYAQTIQYNSRHNIANIIKKAQLPCEYLKKKLLSNTAFRLIRLKDYLITNRKNTQTWHAENPEAMQI